MTDEEIIVLRRKIELKWQLIRLTLDQIKDIEKTLDIEQEARNAVKNKSV